MKRKRLISFAKIFAVTLFISVVLLHTCGCAKKEATSTTEAYRGHRSSNTTPEVKQEVYSFRVEGFGKDKRSQWGLEGASACVISDKINISDLKAVYYGEDTTFTVFADKAVYDKNTQDIELKENIIGTTSDGGELFTSYAKWNSKTEDITTDSYVVVKRKNISCSGRGMVTKPRLKRVEFCKEIEVTIMPDKKITCDGPFELNQDENIAVFNKNVRIIDRDSEILADRLTVYLNPDTNEVERVVTEGNVKVVHRGDVKDIGKISF